MPEKDKRGILVIGGGISGMTTAIEAAEVGYNVFLVEKNPYLGGRIARMNKYFPKLCPPYCGMEINLKRLRTNPKVKHFTLAEVENISGQEGNFDVTVKLNPRYVNEKCTACGECVEACPAERSNEFNCGLDNTKAVYLPYEMSYPMRYVIDEQACTKCGTCVDTCKYGAIDLDMPAKTIDLKVGSIVMATGWQPYDAAKIDNLGFGACQNVITNVMMERLAAPNGPTKGKIVRPSDGKEPRSVVFVQCAGSRDENHLSYCSAVCCLASLKQATYIREQNPDSKVHLFYIDVRAQGKYEDFYANVQSDENVSLVKGKVAKVTEDPATGDVTVEAEDILPGTKSRVTADLVVLATGMVPTPVGSNIPVTCDENGFVVSGKGIYAAGVAKRPSDVAAANRDATGAALRAIQSLQK